GSRHRSGAARARRLRRARGADHGNVHGVRAASRRRHAGPRPRSHRHAVTPQSARGEGGRGGRRLRRAAGHRERGGGRAFALRDPPRRLSADRREDLARDPPVVDRSVEERSNMPKSKRDIIANVARLRERMDRHRLAAVVARSGQNFTYLSGLAYSGTLARHLDLPDAVLGVMLVWPRNGEPVIVLNKIAEGLTRRDSWVERIEVYDAYSESPYRRLAQVLKGLGLSGERVGFEKNY